MALLVPYVTTSASAVSEVDEAVEGQVVGFCAEVDSAVADSFVPLAGAGVFGVLLGECMVAANMVVLVSLMVNRAAMALVRRHLCSLVAPSSLFGGL